MSEIYWITRLDNLELLIRLMIGIPIMAWIVLGTGSFVFEHINFKKYFNRSINIGLPIFILGIILKTFVPNTKEALMIWGVGGSIDYIKSNETAKQLPDKCIQALDKLVDKYMLDTNNNNKENAKD